MTQPYKLPILVLLGLLCIALLTMPAFALTTISTPAELQAMANNLGEDYILTADINLTGITWTPVGTSSTPFFGSLDGDDHTISGLTISTPATDYRGLFGVIGPGSSFTDIQFSDCDISGNSYVGTLFGQLIMSSSLNTTCTITNVDVIGSVVTGGTSGSYVGGIGGRSYSYSNLDISYCDVSYCTMTAGGNYCGGIMGFGAHTNSQATALNCTAENCVITSGGYNCGGIMGAGAFSNSQATALNCTAENCVITAGGNICGGIMGYGASTNSQATALNCTAENCVITAGGTACGGIMGYGAYTNSQATANNCTTAYNTIKSATGYSAGIIGRIYADCAGYVDNCTITNNTVIATSGIAAGVVAAWS
ncbi:MAG: hypothetical protein PHW36_00780 [Bacilli bacterium]|nr:hypothetical protein [Bacilli bacterium]